LHSAVLASIALLSADARSQTHATIIESEGQAEVEVPPDEVGFRLERSFSGPTLIDAMKQVRAFERSVSQGVSDLEMAIGRQDAVRVRVRQRASQLEAWLVLWIPVTQTPGGGAAQTDDLAEAAELVRKLAVSVSANATFAGYGVTDREPHEQEAVARASENALYLADAAGALAQRHVVDVERLTILETRWEGLVETQDGTMPIPPGVKCRARVRIAYRYESGGAPR
jgi:hypothetical protein